jgi:tetratricopeptide (TPR) repeat protein
MACMGGWMDLATMSMVLMAIATGMGEALGGELWTGLASIVRHPFRRKEVTENNATTVASGEAELSALQESPRDLEKAVALAEVLLARAGADSGFERALEEWWKRTEPVQATVGNVTNTISADTQYGPVLQGTSFGNVSIFAPVSVSNTVVPSQPATPHRPEQLPPKVRGFTGRGAELEQIQGLLAPVGDSNPAGVAVAGPPGVGKTTLVIHAAQAAREAGWFPGGVLFINLHGYDEVPVHPREALDTLLRALDIPSEYIPEGTEQRVGRYRSALDNRDDAMLIIADNASAEAQVQPLLPGPGRHRIIITSRHTLAGLDAQQVDVEALDQKAGAELLDNTLRAIRSDDRRISGDPAAAQALAAACDGLPLALWIAAALLAADPALTAGELAGELADEVTRLDELRYDNGSETGAESVAAAFDLSYRKLDKTAARMFRLLASNPGPDISTRAIAALAGEPLGQSRKAVGQLLKAHLVESRSASPPRWWLHDLLRLYARTLSDADPDERDTARNRLLSYYHGAAAYVDSILTRQPPPEVIAPPVPTVGHDLVDRRSALTWAKTELPNLLACADYVARRAEDPQCHQEKAWTILFASALAGILRNEGQWVRSIELQTQAINAATQTNRPLAEANALSERGMLYRLTGKLDLAVADLQQAIAIYREIGNSTGEAHALDTYGVVLDQLKSKAESQQKHNEALRIYRHLNDRLGEANVLQDQGMTQLFAGNYLQSAELFGQALALYQAVDQPLGMAHAYANLARAQREVGLGREAEQNLESAQALYHNLGNRLGEITTLIQLGTVLGQHDRRRANVELNKARKLSSEIGNQIGLVNALDQIAELRMARVATRRFAIDLWNWALEITQTYGLKRERDRLTKKLRRLGLMDDILANDE